MSWTYIDYHPPLSKDRIKLGGEMSLYISKPTKYNITNDLCRSDIDFFSFEIHTCSD